MRTAKTAPYFAKEVDLCASFLDALTAHNERRNSYNQHKWTPYAETAGWDILLVSQNDGTQVGIQAKMKLNVDVLIQAIDEGYHMGTTGPDFRAILVPADRAQNGVGTLAARLGVVVLRQTPRREPNGYRGGNLPRFDPHLPGLEPGYTWNEGWSNWLPNHRHKLPDYVPDVAAGASSPQQLSQWKIQALRICVILEERPVTRADFDALRVSHHRWTRDWLLKTEKGWIRHDRTPDFATQHPTIYQQIIAEKETWMPKPVPLLGKE